MTKLKIGMRIKCKKYLEKEFTGIIVDDWDGIINIKRDDGLRGFGKDRSWLVSTNEATFELLNNDWDD